MWAFGRSLATAYLLAESAVKRRTLADFCGALHDGSLLYSGLLVVDGGYGKDNCDNHPDEAGKVKANPESSKADAPARYGAKRKKYGSHCVMTIPDNVR